MSDSSTPSAHCRTREEQQTSVRQRDVIVRPIKTADLVPVSRFLADNFPPDSPAEDWVTAWAEINDPPGADAPNHGTLRRMFKSPTLEPADIDYLYSEITAAP